AGLDTSLTIQNATFTTDINIGDFVDHQAQGSGVPTDAYTRDLGTAVVNLIDGHVAGTVNVGFIERGVLNVTSTSSVNTLVVANSAASVGIVNVLAGASFLISNETTLGQGHALFNNSGTTSFGDDVYASNGTMLEPSIHNLFGGTITLGNGIDLRVDPATSDEGTLINDAGATLISNGSGLSSSQWDIVNNGLIDVQEGSFYL
ncbi:unnamed protein product, partial [Ectocarpus sp. 12 AP-2014]